MPFACGSATVLTLLSLSLVWHGDRSARCTSDAIIHRCAGHQGYQTYGLLVGD